MNDALEVLNNYADRKRTWKQLLRRAMYIVAREWPWWFRHRFVPWHRYHVVHSGLRPGWHDTDRLMEAVILKLFVDFAEKEDPFGLFDTEESPHGVEWEVVRRLYERVKSPEFERLREASSIDESAYNEVTELLAEVVRLRRMYWT